MQGSKVTMYDRPHSKPPQRSICCRLVYQAGQVKWCFPTPAVAASIFHCCFACARLSRRGLFHRVWKEGRKLLTYPPNHKMKHDFSLLLFLQLQISRAFLSAFPTAVWYLFLFFMLWSFRASPRPHRLSWKSFCSPLSLKWLTSHTNTHLNSF